VEPDVALSPVILADIAARLAAEALEVLGGFAALDDPGLPEGTRTMILIGPREPGFWPHLQSASEWHDGAADPVDRWSRRVIGRLAGDLEATALFPFGGPPWHPFQSWAVRTGRCWESPVRLLVHDRQGLMVSFRGALAMKQVLELPGPSPRPCDACKAKPCLAACPPRALTGAGYDLAACHGWLDRPEGSACLEGGCLVRRACPLSHAYARMQEQSAYHMRQFHP
jgi:epoxyqueuosine reductase